jgi:UDP-N-acetylglucosamine 2-epimerase
MKIAVSLGIRPEIIKMVLTVRILDVKHMNTS